jgi:hypothetical protein
MVAVGAGLAASIATIPMSVLATGTMVAGAIEVGSDLVDERNKRRASERASPFAILHHAQQEGILSPS